MKDIKTITQKLIIWGSLLSLSACGSDSAGLTITADDPTLSIGTCHGFTVTRPSPATENLLVQPEIESGQGILYANSSCTQLALFNIQMSEGTDSVKFYYKPTSSGNATLKATTLTLVNEMPAAKDLDGSISTQVQ